MDGISSLEFADLLHESPRETPAHEPGRLPMVAPWRVPDGRGPSSRTRLRAEPAQEPA